MHVINLWLLFSLTLGAGNPPQAGGTPLLMPIGGGYSDTYAGFAAAAVANAHNGRVNILVLPMSYSTHPETITDAERATNLRDAEQRRFQIEEACKRAAPPEITCQAVLAPLLVRADALAPSALDYFKDELAAVFFLGGDQTVAMQVLINTPVEAALTAAYARGTIIAGTSAGCGIQGVNMLAGYAPNFATGNALDFGAAEVWHTPDRRGLPFGIQTAILDQHFWQRSRFGRLLNAIAQPDVPHVGIGVDAYTGVRAPGGTRLEGVFGLYTVAVLDAETYHAAEGVRYRGDHATLSLRNVLVHLLAPGAFAYDLTTRQASLGAPAPQVQRTFEALRLPPGAGPLLLAGDLSPALSPDNPVLRRFKALAGGDQARLLIVAAGYPTDRSAQTNADKFKAALGQGATTFIVGQQESAPLTVPEGTTGIVFIGKDQSRLRPERVAPLQAAWRAGMPLLADNAAAAVLGLSYSAHGPTPQDADQEEIATQMSFLQGNTVISPGLGLLDIVVEPQVPEDNRWGRLFSLAYHHPDRLALGLAQETALELTAGGAQVIGRNVILALDLRQARLALGTNDGFVIANGLLDVFAPGDRVEPTPADVDAAPERVPTPAPVSPTGTSTSTSTVTPTSAVPALAPTVTPVATVTPALPPGKPARNQTLITLGRVVALVVLVGALIGWLSRRQ